jgi:hypothetical protein
MPLDYDQTGSPRENRSGSMRAGSNDTLRLHFARKALHEFVKAPACDNVTLSPAEAHRLLGLCVELIDLCAKVTGRIDPAIGAMVAYAREEAIADALEVSS